MGHAEVDVPLSFDAFRAFFDRLEATGLARFSPRWGITKAALLRGARRPLRSVRGFETDSVAELFERGDGEALWDVTICSEDGSEGIPYFTDEFLLASPEIVAEGRAIEAWLDANPDAYQLFVPISWSTAPKRAREALDWLLANEPRLVSSPLARICADLRRTLEAASGDQS